MTIVDALVSGRVPVAGSAVLVRLDGPLSQKKACYLRQVSVVGRASCRSRPHDVNCVVVDLSGNVYESDGRLVELCEPGDFVWV